MPPETPDPDTCGRLLRAHRLGEGLSQERLAKLAALSPRTIRKIEADRSQPRPATLKILADTLNLSRDDWSQLLALSQSKPGPVPESVAQTETETLREVPRQLPSAPRHFTGRDLELAELDSTNDEPLWIISGQGGIGKTWLALRWAHGNAGDYPDGQLYVNLRGFDADAEPISTSDALRLLLNAFNVEVSAMPHDTESRAGLYRSLLAGRRVLVVLDNARDEQQVTDLLPGESGCTTVITSRNDLMSLTATHGARQLRPGPFAESEALGALSNHLGRQRVEAESLAAAALVGHCGGIPLAVGILAARAAAHPTFPLAVLAEEFSEETDRLDALDTGGLTASLRSVFDGSVRQLPPESADVFRLLGLVSTAGIGVHAAASLVGVSQSRARTLFRELETANLVEQHLPGRFRMHDLTRLYAAELSHGQLSAEERAEGLRRLIDHYVHTGDAADRHASPWRERRDLGRRASGTVLAPTPDQAASLRWFEVEEANIRAAQRIALDQEWNLDVYNLAWVLRAVQFRFGWQEAEIEVWSAACTATAYMDDSRARSESLVFHGQALSHMGRHDEAIPQLQLAIQVARTGQDHTFHAGALYVLAHTRKAQGNMDAAVEAALESNRVAEEFNGAIRLRGETLNVLGFFRAHNGDYEQGRIDCERALGILQGSEHFTPLGETYESLGYIAQQQGRYSEARRYLETGIEYLGAPKGGRPREVAKVYQRLGDVHLSMGEADEAVRLWCLARDELRRINFGDGAQSLADKIAEVDPTQA